ncbi:uracil-DNA glycosylase family protein [Trichomonas vaginalis G3]|uniref:Uracil-DNA glycosylase n=1 Tax=Trichomonas vaginalis (strain ATCC PRA-98 / G3) TaxID=412133 RepID=A2GFQ7_TRIV3|nr:base-excision repair protein, uracil DNA glycosylase family 1 subfamily [Trichomonas vaginalis G3]EAX84009.1 uracil-DNA glycosylase family protein [Trichomonas vaginalis G3]KAI5498356.1 base-excision repair protein, uracil DNA glycosylase family 1 subfamily [Trichomonas vaginalis G3]|eukprot:XP_001296939.1 uracil-DNA glycosylase family protein [Trichomonas vaginalis G3]
MKQTTLNFGGATVKPIKQKIDPIVLDIPKDSTNPDYSKIYEDVEHFKACLEPSWREALKDEFTKPYLPQLLQKIKSRPNQVFPPKEDVLNAFKYCPINSVKVVIIGQDPYKNQGEAHGLSFSVRKGVNVPPSLKNIYKEIKRTYQNDFIIPKHGYLENWARQGVLLLNATLTLDEGMSRSHEKYGWSNFTSAALAALNKNVQHVVYLAWGNDAAKLTSHIDRERNLVLVGGHPSPLNRTNPFSGCDHFRKANKYLVENERTPINWNAINE